MHYPRLRTVTQSDKGLAKIAEDASPPRHAEISLVNVKVTHLMNNNLPPTEILWREYLRTCAQLVFPHPTLICAALDGASRQYAHYLSIFQYVAP